MTQVRARRQSTPCEVTGHSIRCPTPNQVVLRAATPASDITVLVHCMQLAIFLR